MTGRVAPLALAARAVPWLHIYGMLHCTAGQIGRVADATFGRRYDGLHRWPM
jgi:hypothetical protein